MSLLAAPEVAAILSVPLRTAYALMRRMPHVRLGRLLTDAVDAFVAELERRGRTVNCGRP